MRPATVPPAMSTCDMIHPPKMSPFWFASAGIGMTRSAGCLPAGSFSVAGGSYSIQVVQWSAAERREASAEDEASVGDDAFRHRGLRFLEIRSDQVVDQLLVVGVGLALRGLAADPRVDALSGL